MGVNSDGDKLCSFRSKVDSVLFPRIPDVIFIELRFDLHSTLMSQHLAEIQKSRSLAEGMRQFLQVSAEATEVFVAIIVILRAWND